ncbi:MAG: membrane-bound lytic murein transglycosylase D [Maribacter sp.]
MLWNMDAIAQSTSYPQHNKTQTSNGVVNTPPPYATYPEVYPSFNNETIKQRLSQMTNNAVPPRFSSGVRGFVNTYAIKRHESTEVMLGKCSIYFPIFEDYLSKHGLPSDLKHLPILESALKPHAVSRAGAVGLWQFMPATGKAYGLKINNAVDERKDPHKSSDAAARLLKDLHKRYGDWALALAAYNAGPSRVNRAMKKARSKNFWKIQKYLPRETRSYVPGFIAATYIAHYHNEHGLHPIQAAYELQVTETTKIYERITFQEIASATKLPLQIIRELNPSYNNDVIQSSSVGNYLILPYHSMGSFVRHIHPEYRILDAKNYPKNPDVGHDVSFQTVETSYTAYSGESLEQIAKNFNCKADNIKEWNNLTTSQLRDGQVLKIMERVPYLKRPRIFKELSQVDLTKVRSVAEKTTRTESLKKLNTKLRKGANPDSDSDEEIKGYLYYSIRKGESIKDIANKFPGVSIDDILYDNNIASPKRVKSGRVLMIRDL